MKTVLSNGVKNKLAFYIDFKMYFDSLEGLDRRYVWLRSKDTIFSKACLLKWSAPHFHHIPFSVLKIRGEIGAGVCPPAGRYGGLFRLYIRHWFAMPLIFGKYPPNSFAIGHQQHVTQGRHGGNACNRRLVKSLIAGYRS